MDLAPNSTKSMECLKGYSAKPCFVLTHGVGWKLPTFATHYTTYWFVFFPETPPAPSPRDYRDASPPSRHPLSRDYAAASSSSPILADYGCGANIPSCSAVGGMKTRSSSDSSSWKCSSYVSAVITYRTMAATSGSGFPRTSSTPVACLRSREGADVAEVVARFTVELRTTRRRSPRCDRSGGRSSGRRCGR
jgi:hypothetical protein